MIAFVPSLDLVVTRQTGSSGDWEFEEYLRRACAAVLVDEADEKVEPRASAPRDEESAETTVLGVKDARFTLNAEPTFLLGMSYYGALGTPKTSSAAISTIFNATVSTGSACGRPGTRSAETSRRSTPRAAPERSTSTGSSGWWPIAIAEG